VSRSSWGVSPLENFGRAVGRIGHAALFLNMDTDNGQLISRIGCGSEQEGMRFIVPIVVLGLAAGALAGRLAAQTSDRCLFDVGSPLDTTKQLSDPKKGFFNDDHPEARSEHVRWCLKRYHSYAVRSNTYVTYDGRTRFCDSPFD
jgi:hypothetical protein